MLQTDQFGTQLDPPAHWAPEYAAIDEIPPTFAVRPLVVISIVKQVKKNFNHQTTVGDIRKWERRSGRIPAGGVVMVRSDWSKRWPDPALTALTALKFLHRKRHIAICPPSWKHGVRVGQLPEAPLQKYSSDLQWDTSKGIRVRP